MRSVIAAPRCAAPVIPSHHLMANADLIRKDFESTLAHSVEHHHRSASQEVSSNISPWASAGRQTLDYGPSTAVVAGGRY